MPRFSVVVVVQVLMQLPQEAQVLKVVMEVMV